MREPTGKVRVEQAVHRWKCRWVVLHTEHSQADHTMLRRRWSGTNLIGLESGVRASVRASVIRVHSGAARGGEDIVTVCGTLECTSVQA